MDLTRYLEAQENTWPNALAELQNGYKTTHWMWFIFPQIKGLGYSSMAKYYALNNWEESVAYLHHPVLRKRLTQCCETLLALPGNNPVEIFGTPDDLKLKSCMTLFHLATGEPQSVFSDVLNKFYNGKQDAETLRLLRL